MPTAHKYGDVREDGYIFNAKLKTGEQWLSPKAFGRSRINVALHAAKRRAQSRGLPFDLDMEYLIQVFPSDNRCPALGIELSWHGNRDTSPSLDRIVPEAGYVRGNVQWLSNKANTIKSHATTAEICAVADFLRKKLN